MQDFIRAESNASYEIIDLSAVCYSIEVSS